MNCKQKKRSSNQEIECLLQPLTTIYRQKKRTFLTESPSISIITDYYLLAGCGLDVVLTSQNIFE